MMLFNRFSHLVKPGGRNQDLPYSHNDVSFRQGNNHGVNRYIRARHPAILPKDPPQRYRGIIASPNLGPDKEFDISHLIPPERDSHPIMDLGIDWTGKGDGSQAADRTPITSSMPSPAPIIDNPVEPGSVVDPDPGVKPKPDPIWNPGDQGSWGDKPRRGKPTHKGYPVNNFNFLGKQNPFSKS